MRKLLLALLLGAAVACASAIAEAPPAWVNSGRAVPVVADGRVQPLETWAKGFYTRVTGRTDGDALEWVLTALAFPERMPTAEHAPPSVRDLYQGLLSTFDSTPHALTSPFVCLFVGDEGLNPAQALLRSDLAPRERDRLALLLFWRDRSRAGAWQEASQALGVFAGDRAVLEVWHNTVPWAALVAVMAALGLVVAVWRKDTGLGWVSPAVAWLVMSVWLTIRVLVSGRPPVTSLPSTFLLVSWFSLGLAALTSRQRLTSAILLAAGGILPLLSAALQGSADPFAPLPAVLNTNFWLSLHVTTIVAGYAGTLAAGLLGHGYLWAARRKSDLLPIWRNLTRALRIALALTLVGTLLGGVWADQSWGRFWGWDPKENGALLIILWLAFTLHLKPSGWAAEWGSAVAAALALPVLWLSWMGVNLLSQGFHSYGWAPGTALLFFGVLAVDALVLFVLVVGSRSR